MKDYYAILGISPDATTDEVRAAFREQAKRLHPDYYRGDSQPFREAQEAWAVLGDPGQRRVYDNKRPSPGRPITVARSHRPEPVVRRSAARPIDHIGSRPPTAEQLPGLERERLEIVIQLSSDVAASGGVVELPLRWRGICPRCGGLSWRLWRSCPVCNGRGWLVTTAQWRVHLPGNLYDGQTLELDLLDGYGSRLALLLRVAL